MTTETLTLTAFLLARIAEDEEWAPTILSGDGSGEFGGSVEYGPAERRLRVEFTPARLRADCLVKREIVNRYREIAARDLSGDSVLAGMYAALGEVLVDLASVYADHEDFREEWRP